MAESSRKTGSASRVSRIDRTGEGKNSCRNESNRKRKNVNACRDKRCEHGRNNSGCPQKKNNYLNKWIGTLIILAIIVAIVLIIIFICIEKYAGQENVSSVFWKHWAEDPLNCIIVVIGSIGSVVGVICSKKKKEKVGILVFFLILVVGIAYSEGMAYAEVRSAIAKREEESKNNGKDSIEDNDTENSASDIEKNIIPYDVDEDPFMEKNSLQQYYGGIVSDENRQEVMVEILLNNLQYNKPIGSASQSFNVFCETADAEYDTYYYEYGRDRSADSDELFFNRIGRLQQSLENREKADKEFEMPSNERPIATGYKDMGDEYVRYEDQQKAFEAYEKGAQWYMRTICHAGAAEEFTEVELCVEKFKELGEEVSRLNQVSCERKEKILIKVEVYETFKNRLLN